MGAWDAVLTKVVQRSYSAARQGDRTGEGEALRQFDLLVKFGGAADLWVGEPAEPRLPRKGPA